MCCPNKRPPSQRTCRRRSRCTRQSQSHPCTSPLHTASTCRRLLPCTPCCTDSCSGGCFHSESWNSPGRTCMCCPNKRPPSQRTCRRRSRCTRQSQSHPCTSPLHTASTCRRLLPCTPCCTDSCSGGCFHSERWNSPGMTCMCCPNKRPPSQRTCRRRSRCTRQSQCRSCTCPPHTPSKTLHLIR
jgi:hypothetical protein